MGTKKEEDCSRPFACLDDDAVHSPPSHEDDMDHSSIIHHNDDHDDDDVNNDDFQLTSSSSPQVNADDVLRVFACLHPQKIRNLELIQPLFAFPVEPEIDMAIESKMLVVVGSREVGKEEEEEEQAINAFKTENESSSGNQEGPTTADGGKKESSDIVSSSSSSSCLYYYSFPNESVWKSVYVRLVPEKQRERCHLELARKLWTTLHRIKNTININAEEDSSSSSSSTKINNQHGNQHDEEELMDLALSQFIKGQKCITRNKEIDAIRSLCLCAGQVAAKKRPSDFCKAATYLNFGISLLDDHDSWRHDQYSLTLALYNAAAEMECCIGNFAQMDRLIDKILEHAVCFIDKRQAYTTRILGLAASKRVTEALETGFAVLHELGEKKCSFSPNRRRPFSFQLLHFVQEFWRLERDFARKSNGQLLRLPPMEDERILHIMQILNVLIFPASIYNLQLGPLVQLRMMRLTLDYGLSALASVAFSHFGMVCSSLGFFQLGDRCGGLALELLDRYQTPEYLPRVNVAYYGVIQRYRSPPRENIGPLQEAYRAGMITGDLEFAGLAMSLACAMSLEAGDSLDTLFVEYCTFRDAMHSKRQEAQVQLTLPFIQGLHQFMGISNDPLSPTIDHLVMDLDRDCSVNLAQNGGGLSTGSIGRIMSVWQMRLLYVFNDYESAAAVLFADSQLLPDAFIIDPAFGFYCTLVAVAVLRRHQQGQGKGKQGPSCWRKHKQRNAARYGLKRLRQLAKASPYDCSGKLCLVQAELASVHRDNGQAMLHYVMAISLTKQVENTFEFALANERAARHILGTGDAPGAARYFKAALEAYQTWGGEAKVDRLRAEMETLYTADTLP
jgi:hypothetical protein